MSDAIQNARRWLAAYDSQPDGHSGVAAMGAHHVRQLLSEMALMGRRPAEAGYDWLMTNVDQQLTNAAEAGSAHHHHEEDIHLRVAAVRSNQAVAAAIHAGQSPGGWDTMTAQEADAFQSVVMAVLNTSPGTMRDLPGYPDQAASEIIEACHLEGIDPRGVELICSALVEAGPWEEIDGDGTNLSLICEHIERLGKLAFSAGRLTELQVQRMGADLEQAHSQVIQFQTRYRGETDAWRFLEELGNRLADALDEIHGWVGVKCKHGAELVDGVIEEMSAATDGDGIRLVITGEVLPHADIVDTGSVTIHSRMKRDEPATPAS